MQRKTHDTPVFCTFSVEGVELVLDHLQKVIRLAVPGQQARVVGLAGIGNIDEFLPASHGDRPRLVVDDPGRVIEASRLRHQVISWDSVARASAKPSLQAFAGHLL